MINRPDLKHKERIGSSLTSIAICGSSLHRKSNQQTRPSYFIQKMKLKLKMKGGNGEGLRDNGSDLARSDDDARVLRRGNAAINAVFVTFQSSSLQLRLGRLEIKRTLSRLCHRHGCHLCFSRT